MEDFKNYYCLDDTFVGKDVKAVELLYPIYCNIFNITPVNDIVLEICKHYTLATKNGKFVDFKSTLAKFRY